MWQHLMATDTKAYTEVNSINIDNLHIVRQQCVPYIKCQNKSNSRNEILMKYTPPYE